MTVLLRVLSGFVIVAPTAASSTPAADVGGPLLRRDEPYAAQWEVTDPKRACEGVEKSYDSRTRATLTDCMRACEGLWGCLAVDYYAKTKVCNLYRNACTAPVADHDGASSYHIKRSLEWNTISKTAACKDSVKHFYERGYIPSLDVCKQLCENRAGCIAVDYYSATSVCQLYNEACFRPSFVQDGSMSYAIKRELTWVLTSETMGCEGNLDKVVVKGKKHFPGHGLNYCQRWCASINDCRAVDWYKSTGWCVYYDDTCTHPTATADGVQSWRALREGLPKPPSTLKKLGLMRRETQPAVGGELSDYGVAGRPSIWSTIDSQNACQGNTESVQHFKEIKVMALEECQAACENHHKCTAIDWYRSTTYCQLYEQACSTPSANHDGASSMRVVRTDLAAQAAPPPAPSLADAASATLFGTAVAMATDGASIWSEPSLPEKREDVGTLSAEGSSVKAGVLGGEAGIWHGRLKYNLKSLDKEGSGFVTVDHLRQAVADSSSGFGKVQQKKAGILPGNFTQAALNGVLGQAALNSYGQVDYENFLGLVKHSLEGLTFQATI